MQTGNFIEPNPIFKGEDLLFKISHLIKEFQNVRLPIIYIQNMGGVGDPDEVNTSGWQFHPKVSPKNDSLIIQKKTPDSFLGTNLQEKLNSLNVNHLYISGLQTEYCIDTTVRRAFSIGFKVTLIEDGHSTWNSKILTAEQIIDHHNNVLGNWFTELNKSYEITF